MRAGDHQLTRQWILNDDRSSGVNSYYPILVHTRRAEVLTLVGEWDEAERCLQQNHDWSRQALDRKLYADCLSRLAMIAKKRGRYQQAQQHYRTALAEYLIFSDITGQAVATGGLGDIHYYLTEYQQAIDRYQQQLSFARQAGDRDQECLALQSIGVVTKRQGQYQQALQYQLQALEIATAAGNRRAIGHINGNIGTIYYYLQDYDQTLRFYQTDLSISQELGDTQAAGEALGNLGNLYADLRDYERSLGYYHQSEVIFERLGAKRAIVINCDALASICLSLGRFDQARRYLEREMPLIAELDDKIGLVLALGHWGDLHLALNEYPDAVGAYQRAIETGTDIKLTYYLSEIVFRLAELHFSTGNIPQADAVCRQALAMLQQDGRAELAFSCRLLQARIDAASGTAGAALQLESLLREASSGEQRADALFALFMVTGQDRYAQEAAAGFRGLLATCPLEHYRRALQELAAPA